MEYNPADEATKWDNGSHFSENSQWLIGSEFLRSSEHELSRTNGGHNGGNSTVVNEIRQLCVNPKHRLMEKVSVKTVSFASSARQFHENSDVVM